MRVLAESHVSSSSERGALSSVVNMERGGGRPGGRQGKEGRGKAEDCKLGPF
jgi:hypothetical protein